jgi:cyclopropane fatty-acyl-phospholipid synthase-like methyltransferase
MEYPKSDYKEFPKTLAPDDFWGQVRRTVHGKPISDEQITMIVDAIKSDLDFCPGDILLDIACGNGALSRLLFDACTEFVGVDNSDYLISVAKQNFAKPPHYDFILSDAAEYVRVEPKPERFTKALCYGSFSFFSAEQASEILMKLATRFPNISKLYLGNLPDKSRAHMFYPPGENFEKILAEPSSQIGIWRSAHELEILAAETGWKIRYHLMSQEFFAAHYRFDAILEKNV